MANRVMVKPRAPGLIVLDALGRRIPEEGALKILDIHLRRRIKDGDLVVVVDDTEKKIKSGKSGGER